MQLEIHRCTAVYAFAFFCCVSFYPIGAYVYLSDGRVGIVVDANLENSENIKSPIVQLVTEKDADGTPKTVATNDTIKISRALTPAEIASLKPLEYKTHQRFSRYAKTSYVSPHIFNNSKIYLNLLYSSFSILTASFIVIESLS